MATASGAVTVGPKFLESSQLFQPFWVIKISPKSEYSNVQFYNGLIYWKDFFGQLCFYLIRFQFLFFFKKNIFRILGVEELGRVDLTTVLGKNEYNMVSFLKKQSFGSWGDGKFSGCGLKEF
jgi:hypothetical protein